MTGQHHFHVIAEDLDGELICSDGLTWPGAQAFVADLVSPPNGAAVYEPVQTVWILEGELMRCPFAHGDAVPVDEQAATHLLEQLVRQPPHWSA